MTKDKDKRSVIEEIAAAALRELTPPASEDDADAPELLGSKTKQMALFHVLGKPVPSDDEPQKRQELEGSLDEFARDVNRNARLNGEEGFSDGSDERIRNRAALTT